MIIKKTDTTNDLWVLLLGSLTRDAKDIVVPTVSMFVRFCQAHTHRGVIGEIEVVSSHDEHNTMVLQITLKDMVFGVTGIYPIYLHPTKEHETRRTTIDLNATVDMLWTKHFDSKAIKLEQDWLAGLPAET